MRVILAILGSVCLVGGAVVIFVSLKGDVREELPGAAYRLLEHDFGVVEAGGEYEHVFKVHNDTDSVWTLASSRSSCGCTVARIPKEKLMPGENLDVTVFYSAPDTNSDEHREVALLFHQDIAPKVRLRINARVRRAMVLSEELIVVGEITAGSSESHRVLVKNYTPDDWAGIHFDQLPPWVMAKASILNHELNNPMLRQVWAIDLTIAHHSEVAGRVNAKCIVNAVNENAQTVASRDLAITATHGAAFSINPKHLLIDAQSDTPTSYRLSVVVAKSVDPPKAQDLAASHNLGEGFEFHWNKVLSRLWVLECTVSKKLVLTEDSKLTVDVAGKKIDVPIRAVE